ncbi:acyltransferase family protein [Tardiphaga sp. 20_F10_N6_6]|uniref:acyltransferase family protein n=1 Tax=unclassified Tardiphaga TaxID=2631404 RepID=UPI003F1FA745
MDEGWIGFRTNAVTPANLPTWLDLARTMAAIEVVAFHSYQLMFLERSPDPGDGSPVSYLYSLVLPLSAHGMAAVIVFFVLSGYLVGGPAIVRARWGQLNAIDYFAARGARLYVVLMPALVTSICAYSLARHLPNWQEFVATRHDLYDAGRLFSASAGATTAVCNVAFLQTIGCSEFAGNLALWSLSNEFWYYVLIFALVVVWSRPSFTFLIIGILALFWYAERHDPAGAHIGAKFIFYFLIWCLGAAVYAIRAPAVSWLFLFCVGLVGAWLLYVGGAAPKWAASQLATGLIVAGSIVGLTLSGASMPRQLHPLANGAKYSFSLYATHYPILVVLNVIFSSGPSEFTLFSLVRFVSFMLLCGALSVAFYRLFEIHTSSVKAFVAKAVRTIATETGTAFASRRVIEEYASTTNSTRKEDLLLPDARAVGARDNSR